MEYAGEEVVVVPGYCCIDVDHNMDYIIPLEMLTYPLYYFEVSDLTEYPLNDIVGWSLKTARNMRKEYSNDELYDMVIGYKNCQSKNDLGKIIPAGYEINDIIASYLPGWVWPKHPCTGRWGESIVNHHTKLKLLKDEDIIACIKFWCKKYDKTGIVKKRLWQDILKDTSTPYNKEMIGTALGFT